MLFEHHGSQVGDQQLRLRGAAATAGVCYPGHRLYRDAQLVPFGGICWLPVHGAVRHPGRRAGHRLLRRLCAAAARPLRHGTILVLAFVTRFLPIGSSSQSAMRGLNPEMEEAVRMLGGGRLTAMRRVVAPLLKRSLRAPGCWSSSRRRASSPPRSSSYGPNTKVASVMIFDMSEEGNFE